MTLRNFTLVMTAQSTLLMNAYFQTLTDEDRWDEEAIRLRGEVLAGIACRVWPHPDGEVSRAL